MENTEKKFRIRVWILLAVLAIGYILFELKGIEGYWSGLMMGLFLGILFSEIRWITNKRKD
jgi:Na+-driven multidrug efflux pump